MNTGTASDCLPHITAGSADTSFSNRAARGSESSALAQIPEDWVRQKSWQTFVTQSPGHQRQSQGWGRVCVSCCFPDLPDKLITSILKAVNLTLLSNTEFTASPFWREARLEPLSDPQSHKFRVDRETVTPGRPVRIGCPVWRHVQM